MWFLSYVKKSIFKINKKINLYKIYIQNEIFTQGKIFYLNMTDGEYKPNVDDCSDASVIQSSITLLSLLLVLGYFSKY